MRILAIFRISSRINTPCPYIWRVIQTTEAQVHINHVLNILILAIFYKIINLCNFYQRLARMIDWLTDWLTNWLINWPLTYWLTDGRLTDSLFVKINLPSSYQINMQTLWEVHPIVFWSYLQLDVDFVWETSLIIHKISITLGKKQKKTRFFKILWIINDVVDEIWTRYFSPY